MEDLVLMWTALQQAVWVGYGPTLLWILGIAVAGVVLLSAFDLATALFRKYFG